jgi:hypothetical protein
MDRLRDPPPTEALDLVEGRRNAGGLWRGDHVVACAGIEGQ